MKLIQLVESLDVRVARGAMDVTVVGLCDDSREVSVGDVFVARVGSADDGRRYIDEAMGRGAVAAVVAGDVPGGVGELAERFFGKPAEKLKLIAVTGTNGKSTICFLIQHLLERAGMRCGLIGTIVVDDGEVRRAASLTTPGPIEFSRILAGMVERGCAAAVCEVSSHALDQQRVAAIDFDVAVFTNLTGDHLDYHKTMEAYAQAKAKLFRSLGPRAWAIVNRDDAYGDTMVQDCQAQLWWTTFKEEGESQGGNVCFGKVISLAADHSRARFSGPWGSVDVALPWVGEHNVVNALQAVAAANCVVSIARTLREALGGCPAVPGRLERVEVKGEVGTGFTEVTLPRGKTSGGEPTFKERGLRGRPGVPVFPGVLVDYAHTHDSLENVLRTLGPIAHEGGGKLICVFGCGGDRDVTKRAKMGAIACEWSDEVVMTSDNPRSEDPDAIIRDILEGVPKNKLAEVMVINDRAEAIAHAIAHASVDDTVLLAGKGHEDYQIISDANSEGGTRKIHFDDREHAGAALERWVKHHGAGS